MSIKDLFTKGATFKSAASGSETVESFDYINTKIIKSETFQPSVDFASASNFAKYGSAYEYYTQAIERIYSEYPYDGSEKEKLLFELSSSYLDKWIFDNKYPKTTGYIHFSYGGWGTAASITNGYGLPNSSADYEWIYSRGGMHTASSGMINKPMRNTFDKSVIYDADKNRTITYDINGSEGTTIEFWLKKDAFDHSKSGKEVILDLWNGELSSSVDYGRLTLAISGASAAGDNPFKITLQSGTTGVFEQSVGSANITTTSLANWSHYALSLVSASSGITTRLYKNGTLDDEKTLGSTGFGDFPGLVNGYIGALQTSPSSSHGALAQNQLKYAGKLSASLDDFRFWKTRRTSQQIKNNWYRPIGGGTNTDDANVKLGVYYKFNEGIVGNNVNDSTILDYSGRIANGTWYGYSSGARSTSSAFTESTLVASEPSDPIIYSNHYSVANILSELQTSGSTWDQENGSMLYNSLPQWIREDDEESNKNLKYLFQIISNYFDTLHAQITEIPKLKEKKYTEANQKPLPFADRLLTERGLNVESLFVDSKILEKFGARDSNQVIYEKELHEVKNLIYNNIYNNLEFIYKSKGTEKSIRNLLRCFGVDDELIKLNIYTDDGVHYFNDRAKRSSVNKKYINFNNTNYFSSTIYQTSSINNSNSYISGSGIEQLEKYSAFTAEADIIVPHKILSHESGFFDTPFLTSSVFGFHGAKASPADLTWPTVDRNLQVYLIRDKKNSKNAKFVLQNLDKSIYLTSSLIPEIYDNQRWNVAVSIRPEKYELIGNVVTSSNPNYIVEFQGVSHIFQDMYTNFTVTASIDYTSGSQYMSNAKRFYVGSHRTNFSGLVRDETDIQFGSFRYYEDYLNQEAIKQHNLDPTYYGLVNNCRPPTTFAYQINKAIPSNDTIALSWNFNILTGSDAAGSFTVEDFSSGSTDTIYGWIDNIIRREHKGVGLGFGQNNTSFISNEFIFSEKKELPEVSVISDDVYIKNDEEEYFIEDKDRSDHFYSLEKSMYQAISEEMLNMFSTITEFNNLIGKPVDKYRMEYKDLNLLRRMFFDRVTGDLDFDRFAEYFKWIDVSITRIVQDLFPVSARFSSGVSNIIDSHILERNKYQNKFPITTRFTSTEGSAKGRAEMDYNWKTGHAPMSTNENENCLWQKERKERKDITDREKIREAINLHSNIELPLLAKPDSTIYNGSTYVFRHLSKPYKLEKLLKPMIHGGINYEPNKDRDIIHNFVQRAGHVSGGLPLNTFLVGQGTGKGVTEQQKCDDSVDPNSKKYTYVEGFVGKYTNSSIHPDGPVNQNDTYLYTFGSEKMPINIISGTVHTGYNSLVAENFHSQSIITNIHSDTTDITNGIPLQGPFTQNWVGGRQHRHVELNFYDAFRRDDDTGGTPLNGLDNEYTREESWQILFSEYSGSDGAFGFVGPDYGGPYPDPARKSATLYRETRAKRPVNIKNIKTTTQTSPLFAHGNYKENYEIVQSVGKKENNLFLRKNENQSLFLPLKFTSSLPQTTHPMTLIGQAPLTSGNIFGAHSNNRQPEIQQVMGTTANGSFSLYGRRHVSAGTRLAITSSTSMGYVISNTVGGYTTVSTGSTDTDFWNNMTASLQAQQSYLTVNKTDVAAETAAAPFIISKPGGGVKHRNFISASYSGPHFHQKPFSWAGWLYISSSALGGYIYSQSSSAPSGNGYARQLRYVHGSTKSIYFKTNYVSGSSTKYIEWLLKPAHNLADVQDQWFHFAVTHNSGSSYAGTASTDVKMYVNGEERELLHAGDVSMTGIFSPNIENKTYFLLNQNSGSGATFGEQEHRGGGIANVGVYSSVLTNASIRNLYNGSMFADYRTSDPSSLSTLESYLTLTSSNNGVATEGLAIRKGPNPEFTYFTDLISGSQQAEVSCNVTNNMRFQKSPETTKSFAIFRLTASAQGSAFNGSITQQNTPVYPTFFSINNLAGGANGQDGNNNVNSIITSSVTNTIITSRFSAPGGIEIGSLGYLDVYAREYSVYNNLNYRNLTIRSSGSGEAGTIRMNSQLNYREGLQTLLRRHTGQFGADSVHANPVAESYVVVPNFHKVHRNGRKIPTDASSVASPVLENNYDNAFVSSLIPQSDYQYGWVTSSLGNNYSVTSGKQRIYGYTPRDGILSSSIIINGESGFVPALNFPSASEIFGV